MAKFSKHDFIFVLIFSVISFSSFAQLTGPSPVTANVSYQYSYLAGSMVALPTWQATNGTIGTTTQTGLHYTAYITFTVNGTKIVNFYNGSTLLANLSVTVNAAPPSAPVATAASTITTSSFKANWGTVSAATSYQLDVSANSGFTSFVTGYNNLTVASNIQNVTGLTDGTNYWYRVRAVSAGGTSASSNVISTTTTTNPVTGISPATVGQTYQYTYIAGGTVSSPTWIPPNGTVMSTTNTGLNYTAYIKWNSVGTGSADFYSGTTNKLASFAVTVVPAAPTVQSASGCGTVLLTATPASPATTSNWYTAATGGTSFYQGVIYSASPASTTTYYVTSYSATLGETVARTPVTATIVAAPTVAPTVSGNARFGTGTVSLSATGTPTGGSYNWYDATSALVGTGPTYAPAQNVTTTTSNFATVKATNGCIGPGTSVTVSVYNNPVITGGHQVVNGASVTLDAGAGYDTYVWKNGAGAVIPSWTTQTVSTSSLDNYTVTVTKGSLTSLPSPGFTVGDQFYSQNLNYIVSTSVMIDNGLSPTVDNLTIDSKNQTVQYFDGLGRPIQTVGTQASPTKKDMVSPIAYDAYGRESRKYLPFSNNASGWMQSGILDGNNNYAGAALTFYTSSPKVAQETQRPFSETIFEPSPLNRPLQDFGPGQTWYSNNKAIVHQYPNNADGTAVGQERIIAWQINSTTGLPERNTNINTTNVLTGGYYASGQLNVKVSLDEQQNATRIYTNKLGQTILKKMQVVASTDLTNTSQWASTYYVFDDFGNLRFVLQPELSKTVHQNDTYNPTTTDLNNFAFQYLYDARHRMVQKQVPGSAAVLMIYDARDRLVLTQDGNERGLSPARWTFNKYDLLNRPLMTGFLDTAAVLSQSQMQGVVDAYYQSNPSAWGEVSGTAVHGYTNRSYPPVTDPNKYLTVSYYDNYSFKAGWGTTFNYVNEALSQSNVQGTFTEPTSEYLRVTGLITGTKVKVLDAANTWLKTINFYDDHYRAVQTISDNYKGGFDRTTHLYDFSGKSLTVKTVHHTTRTDHNIVRRFVYDHMNRLTSVFDNTDALGEVLLYAQGYNELGQLVDKNLYSKNNGTSFVQSLDYRYNIRGWMTSMNNSQLVLDNTNDDSNVINNDFFGFNLSYNDAVVGMNNITLFNGNISAMRWSKNAALGTAKDVGYNYSYDGLNRILGASYLTDNGGIWSNATGAFSESGYSYDLNGNIKALIRNGSLGASIDNLTYNYGTAGNQLQFVSDAGADPTKGFTDGNTSGNDYIYDVNGNMVIDKNKGLTATNAIHYNHLNLPDVVTKSTNENIQYTYDASGRKLRQQVFNASNVLQKTTDYDGEFIYSYYGTDLTKDTLQFINHEEGRIVMGKGFLTGAAPEYQYHLKDHLGNVRLTLTSVIPPIDQNKATYEDINAVAEQSKFLRYTNARRVASFLFDHTNGSSPSTVSGDAERLVGGGNEVYGLARSISVMPGDVVRAEVYGKYVDTNPANRTTALNTLLSQIASGTVGVVIDGANYATSTSSFPFVGLLNTSGSTGGPKAYLNWLIFDRNYGFINGGFIRMTATPRETGNDVNHELLTSGNLTITQPGYVYIYLSNEETSPVEVYFDDFMVTQTKSPVVQQDDYYPFGLKFNSYSRENSAPNTIKLFQGQEHIDDLGLNWDSFKWRNHQPDIGRFFNVDPLADKYVYNSPYAFSENHVIAHVELEGLEKISIKLGKESTVEYQQDENLGKIVVGRTGVSTSPPDDNDLAHQVTLPINNAMVDKNGNVVHSFEKGLGANMTIHRGQIPRNMLKGPEVKINNAAMTKFMKMNMPSPTISLRPIPVKLHQNRVINKTESPKVERRNLMIEDKH